MPPRQPSSEPPSISPEQAVHLIKRQITRLEEISNLRYDDPKIDGWESTTTDILDRTYVWETKWPFSSEDLGCKACI